MGDVRVDLVRRQRRFLQETGKDLYNHLDNDNSKTNEANYNRDIEFNWTEDDPESMKRLCPRLFERFTSNS